MVWLLHFVVKIYYIFLLCFTYDNLVYISQFLTIERE